MVVAVLGGALLVTKRRADQAAEMAAARAVRATTSAIRDALDGRSRALRQLTAALVQVPAYVSRIGEAIRSGDRANLLDQADELRAQTDAAWVLITDASGILKAWTSERDVFDEDFSRGALIGRALEGRTTEGLWLEPGPEGDRMFQAVGVPVANPGGGAPFGVVVAALAIDSGFVRLLQRHTNAEVAFFSLDTLGRPQLTVSTLPAASVRGALSALGSDPAPDSVPRRIHLSVDGESYQGAVGTLRSADGAPLGGYAGLHARAAELTAFGQLGRTIGWAFVAGLALALGFAVLLARQITRPVQRLVDATREVSEGRYTGRIDVRSRDEIGELAGAFRHMVEELREKERLVEYLRTGAQRPPPPGGATPEGALAVGSRFAGRYDIQEVLGSGGMGVVYRGLDREIGETVALKALRPELGSVDPTLLERFKQELRLARRITHRNVVRTYDLGEVDGIYYITMEFVQGTSLAALIRDAGRLAIPAALTIGKQLCRALEAAHEEGVVHRDIKPQNLLVEPSGFLKVMDFGIARLAERPADRGQPLTAVGVVIGTPQYMAPEQVFGEPVDARADIYAAGAVLFECVTGRPVFEGASFISLASRHLNEVVPDPATLNPEVPEGFARAILRALSRRPEDRWSSAGEMLHALEAI